MPVTAIAVLCFAALTSGCATTGKPSDLQPAPAAVAPMSSLGQRAVGRAQAALVRGDLSAASTYLDDAREHDPRHPDVWLLQARLADARSDSAGAAAAINRALAVAPGYGPALNARGVWHCQNKRWSEAQADFAAALLDTSDQGTARVLTNAGVCALEAPDPALAETLLRQALVLSPSDPLVLISLAKLELQSGNGLAARGFLQRREALGALSPVELPVAIAIETLAGDQRARTRYENQLQQALEVPTDTSSPPPGGS